VARAQEKKEETMRFFRTTGTAIALAALLGAAPVGSAAAQYAPAPNSTQVTADLIDAVGEDSLLVNNDAVLDQLLSDSLNHGQLQVVYLNNTLGHDAVARWSAMLDESDVLGRNRDRLTAALNRNGSLRGYVQQHTPAGWQVVPLAIDVRGGTQSVVDRLNNALGHAVDDVLGNGDLGRAVDHAMGNDPNQGPQGVPVTLYVLTPQ
jgi:hypothetical protein